MTNVTFRPCTRNDESAITDFLWSIKDDLLLSDRSAAAEITQLLFEKGGVLAGYHNNTLITMLGYFIGEPSRNYVNKEIGFIYVTGIAKAHRLSRIMWNGLGYMIRHLHALDVKEIRCHAGVHDPYTNRLYSHFAKRLGEDVTLRGRPAVLYGNTVEGVLAYLDKGRSRQSKRAESPTQSGAAINGVAPNQPMTHQPVTHQPVIQPSGSLWHCSPCNVWWLSRASASPENWHLERMTEVDLTKVDPKGDTRSSPPANAPAWNVSGPALLFCPECGKTMNTQTLPEPNAQRDQPRIVSA